MARTKAAGFDKQRAALRDGAAREFADKGYAAATISDIARACGVSKALMYHYYRDKEHLLADIAESYIERLQSIVDEVDGETLTPAAHLRRLIELFMAEYEHSAARHRVLVQDVKYLQRAHRSRVLAKERKVVLGFADVVAKIAPQTERTELIKPLTMILFGMINWTFTWLKDRGPLTYTDMAPIVADLFLGGITRVRAPTRPAARRPRAAATARVNGQLRATA
ncbi:MAG TPA: TetR/AcrR family transcriptional regulator [Burkholderiaceae bacterium]|jgi:AcrR family transcriptional regulator|nr:TetR/AcrR family transcriptional regulator [Burkholderiaceae bacterium]